MCKSGELYPNPTSVWSMGMDVRRAAPIWKVMMNPHDMKMKNISYVFFDSVLRVSNMRYFKFQKLAHDHCNEDSDHNRVLWHACVVDLDADVANLRRTWLKGDAHEGIVENLHTIWVC